MLHTILHILAIIGIVALIIIGILVAIILLLLLTPFCYKAKVQKNQEGFRARVRVCWLFRAIYFRLDAVGKEMTYELYLFGIPILKLLKNRKKKSKSGNKRKDIRKARKARRKEAAALAKENRTADTLQETPKEEKTSENQVEVEIQAEPEEKVTDSQPEQEPVTHEQSNGEDDTEKKTKQKKVKQPGKISGILSKVSSGIKLLRQPDSKAALRVVIQEVKGILRHILPRTIKGRVRFGFEAPDNTGKVLAILAIAYPVMPKKLVVEPDFEEPCLEADVLIKGRIFLIVLLVRVLRILFNKNVRKLIRKIRHKEA